MTTVLKKFIREKRSSWKRRIHTNKMRRFYAQFIQPGDLAFDVGANIGSRTKTFLALGATVVAVEPIKENVRMLFARFHDANVRIVPRALGATAGEGKLVIASPCNATASSLNPKLHEIFKKEKPFQKISFDEARMVKLTTLDALITEYGLPAFIKLDVEGYEHQVLKGLSTKAPALSFEFVPLYLDSALQSLVELSRFGAMLCNYVVEEQFKFELDDWVSADEMSRILLNLEGSRDFIYGDVYVRFVD